MPKNKETPTEFKAEIKDLQTEVTAIKAELRNRNAELDHINTLIRDDETTRGIINDNIKAAKAEIVAIKQRKNEISQMNLKEAEKAVLKGQYKHREDSLKAMIDSAQMRLDRR